MMEVPSCNPYFQTRMQNCGKDLRKMRLTSGEASYTIINFLTTHALDSMTSLTKVRKMQFSISHLAQNLGPSLVSLISRQFVNLKIDLSRIDRETTRKIRVKIITKIN